MKNLIITIAILAMLLNTIFISAQNIPSNINTVNVSVENEDGIISLQWKTSREINTSYFITEKSTDGIHYNAIATNKAASSSMFPRLYQIEDISKTDTVVYYRVVLVLMNGERIHSVPIVYHQNNVDDKDKNIAQK